jgi:hypothetical protein
MPEKPDPFEMLFRAKWNVPQAAEAAGLLACEESWSLMKETFRKWCSEHEPDYMGS